MKFCKLFSFTVTAIFVVSASAQEYEVDGVQQPLVQWSRYLSIAEKEEIASKLAVREYKRRRASGTLNELDGGKSSGLTHTQEITIQDSIIPEEALSESGQGVAANALVPAGDVSCTIQAHYPHAGSGPSGTEVKAKSDGYCFFTHTGPGPQPPTIQWDLSQGLNRIEGHRTTNTWTITHTRNGLNPQWGDSGTQIFTGRCENGRYLHSNSMWVTAPSGWVYTGPNPIQFDTVHNSITEC